MDRGAWKAYSPWDCKELDTTKRLNTHAYVCVYTRCMGVCMYVYLLLFSHQVLSNSFVAPWTVAYPVSLLVSILVCIFSQKIFKKFL